MKKITLGILLASSPLTVMAAGSGMPGNWVGGISYINFSEEEDSLNMDISLGGVVASLGYKIHMVDNFYLVPEVRVGTGISDDTVTYLGVNVDVELDGFFAVSVRGQYEFDNQIYLFAAPAYANAEFTASVSQGGQSFSVTEDSWEFGIGLGAGYNFTDTIAAEVMYERFDGTDIGSLGLKFNF